MPARKSVSGTTARGKKAAGMAQPTLAFSQRRPGLSGTKTKSSTSITSIDLEPETELEQGKKPLSRNSSTSIDLTLADAEAEPVRTGTALSAKKTTAGSTTVASKEERRSLNPKSKEWAGVYKDAKIAMGNMEPIHAGPDTHNQVHHILRVFDMTSKYGPSVGVTRLQRWERAKKWGLNPPQEIHSILTTKEGEDEVEYRENVLHAWI